VEVKSNYLRKGRGSGGSPTRFDQALVDQETGKMLNKTIYYEHSGSDLKKSQNLIPIYRDNPTQVRIRTKNNSYVYSQQNIDSQEDRGNMNLNEQVLWQKKKEMHQRI